MPEVSQAAKTDFLWSEERERLRYRDGDNIDRDGEKEIETEIKG